MEQSQLIELIQTLTSAEKAQLLEFASMEIITSGKNKPFLINLLHLAIRISNNQNWNQAKNEAYLEVFPGQDFVEGKLEKLMVEAHKTVRSFLLFLHHIKNQSEFDQHYYFGLALKERGLTARFQNALPKLKKIQEKQAYRNPDFYLNEFRMEYALHDEASLNNQTKGELNISKVLAALEAHYYLHKISLINRLILQRKVANFQIDAITEEIISNVNVPKFILHDSPLIAIHHSIFNLLSQEFPSPENARKLFQLLQCHEANLEENALKEFYTYLRNICVLVLYKFPENEEINNLLFDLYEDNLKRGLLHYEGKLHPSRYLAISEYATRVNKYDWALEFIEKYKDEIIGDNETGDIYRLNLAYYYFGIRNFSACLDNIPGTSPFVDHLIAGKRLELKALYELDSDLLTYKLDAYKMFLSRTSHKIVSESRRTMNQEFANFLYQLIAAPPADMRRAERVLSRIKANSQTAEWKWLMEKARELVQKATPLFKGKQSGAKNK